MADRNKSAAVVVLLTTTLVAACGPQRLVLPTGAGTPVADYAPSLSAARSYCETITTLQVELAMSGRAAGQRIRGRVLAGLVPGALRLEAVAPFGSPVFILVADGLRGTLLLLRDRRVLQDAPPEEILNALVGVRLGPDDLRAVITGCAKAVVDPSSARAYGEDWIAIDLSSGGTIYLRRQAGTWRIVAGRYQGLEVDYAAFSGNLPSRVVLRGSALNLGLGVSQVDVNAELPREKLVGLAIPSGMTPLTIDELRRAGPLGE